jgi:hypothetical protein
MKNKGTRIKLDDIDRRILRDLQDNGRITNVELARRAGISAPPCLRRVRVLEDAGYIRGYHADLEPKALGFNVTVFAQVGLESQAEADLEAFEQLPPSPGARCSCAATDSFSSGPKTEHYQLPTTHDDGSQRHHQSRWSSPNRNTPLRAC